MILFTALRTVWFSTDIIDTWLMIFYLCSGNQRGGNNCDWGLFKLPTLIIVHIAKVLKNRNFYFIFRATPSPLIAWGLPPLANWRLSPLLSRGFFSLLRWGFFSLANWLPSLSSRSLPFFAIWRFLPSIIWALSFLSIRRRWPFLDISRSLPVNSIRRARSSLWFLGWSIST